MLPGSTFKVFVDGLKDLFIPYTLGDGSFLTALISTILVLNNEGPVEFNFKQFLSSSPNYKNDQKYEYFTLRLQQS
jgi:hypothetical protein